MTTERRSVAISAALARAFQRAPAELHYVREAEDIDRAFGEEGNEHVCPLCHEFFSSWAFRRHAPSCIRAYAPLWERQRDRDPGSQYRGRLFGPTGRKV